MPYEPELEDMIANDIAIMLKDCYNQLPPEYGVVVIVVDKKRRKLSQLCSLRPEDAETLNDIFSEIGGR